MTASVVGLLWMLSAGSGSPKLRRSPNAIADAVVRNATALGVDFNGCYPNAPHPDGAAREAFDSTGWIGWLNRELASPQEAISEPPASVRDFEESHRDTIDNIVSALEKGSPDWGTLDAEDGSEKIGSPEVTRLLPLTSLSKILLVFALSEERRGRAIEAERALEASWSLAHPVDAEPGLVWELISVQIERWQVGVLRRLQAPSLSWMGRLERDDPYRRMIEAWAIDRGPTPSGLRTARAEAFVRARETAAEALLKMSPCEFSVLSEEDVRRLGRSAFPPVASEDTDNPELIVDIMGPEIAGAIRRAGRHSIDRELTLKILRLKLEKQESPTHLWPTELLDSTSTVCPEAGYSYRSDQSAIDLRFDGSIVSPEGASTLALSFQSSKPRPTATPAAIPTPTSDAP